MANASIVGIYERVSELTKTGTSGYVDQDEFNDIIYAKQLTLLQLLIDVEGENEKAADLIKWLKTYQDITASASGILTLPDDYLFLGTISLKVGNNLYPAGLLQTDEIDMTRTSPVRAPSITDNEVNYYFEGGEIVMMPEQAMTVRLRYFMTPPQALITLTPSSDDDNDYLIPSVNIELGWPDSAFNLLSYLVLMDYGIELKEQAIFEFSQFGITMEMVKNQPA